MLVFFGGVDEGNYTSTAIEALSLSPKHSYHIDVVIGAQHPYRTQVEEACMSHGYDCHVQSNRIGDLMAAADLAIGAGGSASWERCCLGLPTLLVALAENQVGIASQLNDVGASDYAGTAENASTGALHGAIERLLYSPRHVAALSQKSYSLVDGQGVNRVCAELTY
jgi:spore coat polysaccharide biosynthesis predicted glycosyltransferase SpsG